MTLNKEKMWKQNANQWFNSKIGKGKKSELPIFALFKIEYERVLY